MRYITNVVSDEYGRIMRWDDLPVYDENGQAVDRSGDENAVALPEEAEDVFYAYCGKKSKVVNKTVVTDMTLPEWKSEIVLRNEQTVTNDDIIAAVAELGEIVGGLLNG